LPVLEELIGVRSWWDTVDFLAPKLAGPLLLRYPELIGTYPGRWIESDNIWYQRSAILFQLDYKQQTDAQRLFDYIRRRADSREFFVQKAAGWALRQYSKTAPDAVREFIAGNELPPLTVREGLKWVER
jgi:3-methyladenine DNA glycosylase AlkD